MKRTLTSFFVSTLLVLICLTLVACAPGTDAPAIVRIGEKYPDKVNTTYKISDSMTAFEMYKAGVKNFYKSDYVATRQQGTITTNAPVIGVMSQNLDVLKIKDDSKYFLDSTSFTISGSPAVAMSDQCIYDSSTEVFKARSSNLKNNKSTIKNNQLIINKWDPILTYDSLSMASVDYPNDPTKINMLNINSSNKIINSTKPVYDAKNKTYKFTLDLNPSTSTIDYASVVKANASKSNSPTVNGLVFVKMKLTIEMWDNGLIKSIANEEEYNVTVKMGIEISSPTTLLSTTYFTYDRAEVNINNYINLF